MIDHAKKLYDELLEKLESFDGDFNAKMFSPDQRIELITESFDQLKAHLKTNPYKNEKEEIQFFKTTLPLYLSLFIYYNEKFDLESIQLIGTPKSIFAFREQSSSRIDDFFRDNAAFFKYYRSGKTNLDHYYFLCGRYLDLQDLNLTAFLLDPLYSTFYSIKVATILAYTQLEKDIRHSIPYQTKEEHPAPSDEYKLTWTDPKAGLVELIYSLKEQGAFNHGAADLKQITRYFEYCFSVRIPNTTRTFQEILTRKKGYTIYLDRLRDNLNRKIDSIEAEHIH